MQPIFNDPADENHADREHLAKSASIHFTDEALHHLLHRVGGKWTIDILSSLYEKKCRFNELRDGVDGISQRSLSLVTQALVRDGLVQRTVFPVIPPRVDYELTDLGIALIHALMPVARWCEENTEKVLSANEQYDAVMSEPLAFNDEFRSRSVS